MIGIIDGVTAQYGQTLSANISPEDWRLLAGLLVRLEENACSAP